MFEINVSVTVNAPGLESALLALAEATGKRAASVVSAAAVLERSGAQQNNSATPAEAEEKQQKRRSTKTQPEPQPESATETTDEATKSDDSPAKIPTVVDLRAAAQAKGETPAGKTAVRALLKEFGSKAVSEVPEEKRAEFLSALESL